MAGPDRCASRSNDAVRDASYLTGGGWVNFPVYTFSDDQYYGTTTTCGAIAACVRAWPQVLTNDQPGTRGGFAPLGNGNNIHAFGGTFHLVYNP
jgi:hypothetical protein